MCHIKIWLTQENLTTKTKPRKIQKSNLALNLEHTKFGS